jgi:hypothetical protein
MTIQEINLLSEEREKAEAAYRGYISIMRYVNELERRYELPETHVQGKDLDESITLITEEMSSIEGRLTVLVGKLRRIFA